MHTARQHTEAVGVIESDGDQFVVGQDSAVEELEKAMLRRLSGGDVAL
jgi:hypothetical protein